MAQRLKFEIRYNICIIVVKFVTMYLCYLCSHHTDSLEELRLHFECHKFNGQLMMPVICCLDQYNSEFTTVFNFRCHLKSYHSVGNSLLTCSRSLDADELTENQCFFVKEYFPVLSSGGNQCKNWHAPIWHFG